MVDRDTREAHSGRVPFNPFSPTFLTPVQLQAPPSVGLSYSTCKLSRLVQFGRVPVMLLWFRALGRHFVTPLIDLDVGDLQRSKSN